MKKVENNDLENKDSVLNKVCRFLYHKESKNFYSKTYICGIRVRKRVKQLEFMKSQVVDLKEELDDKIEQFSKSQNEFLNDNIKALQEKLEQIAKNQDDVIKENTRDLQAKVEQLAKAQKEFSMYNFNQICDCVNSVKICAENGANSVLDKVGEVQNEVESRFASQQVFVEEKAFGLQSVTEKLFDDLKDKATNNCEQICGQIAGVEKGVGQISAQIGDVEKGVGGILDKVGEVQNEVESRFASQQVFVEEKAFGLQSATEKLIDDLKDKATNNCEQICGQIADVEKGVGQISAQINGVEKIVENSSEKYGIFADDCFKTLNKQTEQLVKQQEVSLNNKEQLLQGIKDVVAKAEENKKEISKNILTTGKMLEELCQNVNKNKENQLKSFADVLDEFDCLKQNISNSKAEIDRYNSKQQKNYQELNYADLLHDSIVNSVWLKDKAFSLYGWAANYSFIYTLFRILDKAMPKNILEMGLGQTTKLTSQYVAYKNNDAKLNVCEHNQDWIDIYKKDLVSAENIKINHFDLEFFDYEGKQNDKYKGMLDFVKTEKFDLIIVDGPIGGGKNLPRSNVIDLIDNHNLADDFIIIFDDAERVGEQTTINKAKERLKANGIEFFEFSREGIKKQYAITSASWSFVKYL